jgi:hypothetical protein
MGSNGHHRTGLWLRLCRYPYHSNQRWGVPLGTTNDLIAARPSLRSSVAQTTTESARSPEVTKIFSDGNDYILNGEKIFVTSGERADSVVVWATLDRKLGQHPLRHYPKGSQQVHGSQ